MFAPVPLPVLTVVHTVSPSIVHHSWASFFHTNTFTLAKVFDVLPATWPHHPVAGSLKCSEHEILF